MILDSLNEFSDAQAITDTAVSTNVIDLGPMDANTRRDIGVSDIYLVVQVDVAFTDDSSDSTVTVSWQTDVTAAFSGIVTLKTHHIFPALSAVGDQITIKLSPDEYEQFNRLNYVVTGGDLTTGSLSAFLTLVAPLERKYASGFDIQ